MVFDACGRLLLIRRGQEPSAGTWSVPGGRCRADESGAEACVREVAEETGLTVRIVRWLGQVERPGPAAVRYVIDDFECAVVSGRLRAADDAADARWMSRADLASLTLAPLLAETLRAWGCLPRC